MVSAVPSHSDRPLLVPGGSFALSLGLYSLSYRLLGPQAVPVFPPSLL